MGLPVRIETYDLSLTKGALYRVDVSSTAISIDL